jgi:sugar phosphate permease
MGIGFSAGMMASLKVYALWFPTERLPTINSLQFMIGVLGAWSATKPVELLLRIMDWRELYLLFAAVTVLGAALMILVAPRHETHGTNETLGQQLRGLATVYTDAYFWRIAPWMCVSVGVAQGLGTLYLFSWFTDVASLSVSRAATGASLVTLASAANFALMGPLAESLGRRGFGPLIVPVAGQCLAMLLLAVLAAQFRTAVVPQWMVWTICSGTSTLAFAALSQAFPTHMMGRVYTAFNLLGFLATATAQWLVGRVLDRYPAPDAGGAAPEGYAAAFLLLLACQVLASVWFAIATWRGIGAKTLLMKTA